MAVLSIRPIKGKRNYTYYSLEFYADATYIQEFWTGTAKKNTHYKKESDMKEYEKVLYVLFGSTTAAAAQTGDSSLTVDIKNITFSLTEVY